MAVFSTIADSIALLFITATRAVALLEDGGRRSSGLGGTEGVALGGKLGTYCGMLVNNTILWRGDDSNRTLLILTKALR